MISSLIGIRMRRSLTISSDSCQFEDLMLCHSPRSTAHNPTPQTTGTITQLVCRHRAERLDELRARRICVEWMTQRGRLPAVLKMYQ